MTTILHVSENGEWVCFGELDFVRVSQIKSMKIDWFFKSNDFMQEDRVFTVTFNIKDEMPRNIHCDSEKSAREIVQRLTTKFSTLAS